MIKTVLIEDDEQNIECINSLIQYYQIPIDLLGIATNLKKGKELIQKNNPDLLLLDIELPDGHSIDMLREFKELPWIIFLTGHTDYVFDSYDFPTIHYLIKPINADKLNEAVNKYLHITKIFEKTKSEKNDKTIVKKLLQKIALPTINGVQLVEISKIIRLESESNYTYLFLADGSKILVSKTLSTFEETLPNDIFIRVHKSHIVNISYIKSIQKSHSPYIILSNSIEIPVAPNRKDELIAKLQDSVLFLNI